MKPSLGVITALLAAAGLLSCMPGCQQATPANLEAIPAGTSTLQVLEKALAKALAELPKNAAGPPMLVESAPVLAQEGYILMWDYASTGDYDQNGEVNTADLVPLAQHYLEQDLDTGFARNLVQSVIDGDGNGELNLADVTPIAVNFQNVISEYRIYATSDTGDYPDSPADGNGNARFVGIVPVISGIGEPTVSRKQFSYLLEQYNFGEYVWVRPSDGTLEGTPSNLHGPLPELYDVYSQVIRAGYDSPLPGATLVLGGATDRTGVSGASGGFRFGGLEPGEYLVTPQLADWEFTPDSAVIDLFQSNVVLEPFVARPMMIARSWDTPLWEEFTDIAIDSMGNLYACGWIGAEADGTNLNDCLLVKYDSQGGFRWAVSWGWQFDDYCGGVEIEGDDNVVVLGSIGEDSSETTNSCFVAKFTPAGDLATIYRYDYNGFGVIPDQGKGFKLGLQNRVYPQVAAQGRIEGSFDFVLLWENNTLGQVAWQAGIKRLGRDKQLVDMETYTDRLYVLYRDYDYDGNPLANGITCYNSSGIWLWASAWYGGESDIPVSLAGDVADPICVVGNIGAADYGKDVAYLRLLDETGEFINGNVFYSQQTVESVALTILPAGGWGIGLVMPGASILFTTDISGNPGIQLAGGRLNGPGPWQDPVLDVTSGIESEASGNLILFGRGVHGETSWQPAELEVEPLPEFNTEEASYWINLLMPAVSQPAVDLRIVSGQINAGPDKQGAMFINANLDVLAE